MGTRRGAVVVFAVMACVGAVPARAADETLGYRVNPAHTNAIPDSPLRPPLRTRWEVRIGHTVSNIVVAGGRVFLVNDDNVKAEVTALDAASGQVLWRRPGWKEAALAYEAGRLFVARLGWAHGDPGRILALDAADGDLLWQTVLPGEGYGINAPPTAADGTLYVTGNDGSARLYALRTSNGSQRWVSPTMLGGYESSPTLDSGSAYLAYGGGQIYAAARDSGQFRWHHQGCCSGGGGSTAVVYGGLLFHNAEGNLIHDAATGRVVGSFQGYTGTGAIPTFSGDLGIFVPGNKIVAIARDGAERWTYAALDPYDSVAWPLIVGNHVYVKEGDEFVTAVDLATGRPSWCAVFFAPPGSGTFPENTVGQPHAGHGMLLVPIGYGLVALESGGSASGCPGDSGGPGSDPAGRAGPELSLRPRRREVAVGSRVRLGGTLAGVANPGGRVVRIQADAFPFGRFRTVRRVRTEADGAFGGRLRIRRNTRVRAELAGTAGLRSAPVTIFADFPVRFRRLGAGGSRPRLQVTVKAPRNAAVRDRPVFFYLAGRGQRTWRRVGRRSWHPLGRALIRATALYPAGRLGPRDRVLICTRERKPDGYGRHLALERRCGRRTLPRAQAGRATLRLRAPS